MFSAIEVDALFVFLGEVASGLNDAVFLVLQYGGLGVTKGGDDGKEDGNGKDGNDDAKKQDLPTKTELGKWMHG
jgi:hypothetical protein